MDEDSILDSELERVFVLWQNVQSVPRSQFQEKFSKLSFEELMKEPPFSDIDITWFIGKLEECCQTEEKSLKLMNLGYTKYVNRMFLNYLYPVAKMGIVKNV
jgi:hypothetical protein